MQKPSTKINGEQLYKNDVFGKNGSYYLILYPVGPGKTTGKNRKCKFLSAFKKFNRIYGRGFSLMKINM